MEKKKKTTEEVLNETPKKTPSKARKTTTRKPSTRKPRATKKVKEEEAKAEETQIVETVTEQATEPQSVVEETKDNLEETRTTIEKPSTDLGEQPRTTPEEQKNNPEEPKNDIEEQHRLSQEKQKQEQRREQNQRQEIKVPALPNIKIRNIVELAAAPQRSIILTDQQIQQLSLEEIEKRHLFLQETLASVLDYDVVISDTNIWLELLIGHTSSHSDPRVNARLMFERQLEFISKFTHYRGGRFMMMGETYEEIDRFATMIDPQDHRDADFSDNLTCLNAAARLAKRLILSQQRENRLRIDGIGAESHHAAFADPAIIRKVADLFSEGKKVLLLTNDASVAIRSMGICDDLQQYNGISDKEWDETYALIRPMVFTFDDLKLLDYYTRQYHYIQMASGEPWMANIPQSRDRIALATLSLCMDAFRPGDKHRGDNLNIEQVKQQPNQQKQNQQKQQNSQQKQQQNQQKQQQQNQQKQKQQQQNQPKPQPAEQKSLSVGPKPAEVKQADQQPVEQKQSPIEQKQSPVEQKPQDVKPAETVATEPVQPQMAEQKPDQQPAIEEQKPKQKPRRKSQNRRKSTKEQPSEAPKPVETAQ